MNQSVACHKIESEETLLEIQQNKQRDEQSNEFFNDVLEGLSSLPKTLPCKYFYDEQGSLLFEKICQLDEYYITRTELAMLNQYAPEMAGLIGEDAVVIEPGSGAGEKIRILLDSLNQPEAYIPIEISKEILKRSAKIIEQAYPSLQVYPIESDFTHSLYNFAAAVDNQVGDNRCLFFPGSTLGNFSPSQSVELLKIFAGIVGSSGCLLVGLDRLKPVEIIKAAYNDIQGVTAAFNKNILQRINNELGANFDISRFKHEAIFNAAQSRIEMLLISQCEQTVDLGGDTITFDCHETIHTENSYKYSDAVFTQLVEKSGLTIKRHWLDELKLFSIYLLVPSE
jgi:dimethylhistidine N-methyltransferase